MIYADVLYGLLLPFVGTTLGAAMVFFLREDIKPSLQKLLLGFASGVMIAASVWSLLIPSINMATASGGVAWVPAVTGFLAGMFALLLLDSLVPHLHLDSSKPEGVKSNFGRSAMLVLAVTLHNIPEGMAVGVVFAGVMTQSAELSMAAAMALSFGIAIQNFPEGACVAMPLKNNGHTKYKAFVIGSLSAIVEPISGVLGALFALEVQNALPFLLTFSAGAMIAVVCSELIPDAFKNHKSIATIGVVIGFIIMMVLDVALG